MCPLSGAVNGHQTQGIISTAKMSLTRNVNNSLGPQWPRNVKLWSDVDILLLISAMETFLWLCLDLMMCVMSHQAPDTGTMPPADNVTMSQRCAIPGCLIQHRWYRLVTLVMVWPCVAPGSLCRVITPSLAPFKHLTPWLGPVWQCVTPAVTGTIGINTEIWDAGGVFT